VLVIIHALAHTICACVQYEKEAEKRGRRMLRMPPVKKAWEVGEASKSHVLCMDDISLFESPGSKHVFTDITYGLPHRVGLVAC